MTTFTKFNPLLDAPFVFTATLDGATHNVIVWWNTWAQRWFVTVTDNGGNLVFTKALVSSQGLQPIATLSWAAGTVTIMSGTPLQYPVGALVPLTFYNTTPNAYNGPNLCAVVNRTTLSYPMPTNPGIATSLGGYAFDVTMTAGYFNSTLVYRPTTDNFEVSP